MNSYKNSEIKYAVHLLLIQFFQLHLQLLHFSDAVGEL